LFPVASKQFPFVFYYKIDDFVLITGKMEYQRERSHSDVNTVPRPFLIPTNLSHTYQFILGRSHSAVLSVLILLQEKVAFRVIY
jgi:hypothetical protein